MLIENDKKVKVAWCSNHKRTGIFAPYDFHGLEELYSAFLPYVTEDKFIN
jgi:hypothetical protein